MRASKFKSPIEISSEETEKKSKLKEKASSLSADQVIIDALKLALDQKALDPVVFNLSNSIAEKIMIVSGTSTRHVKGISDKILEGLSTIGIRAERMEGYNTGEWVVLDYGNILIHLFYEPTRQYYALDELLSPNPKVKFSGELETQIRSFKTGLHQIL